MDIEKDLTVRGADGQGRAIVTVTGLGGTRGGTRETVNDIVVAIKERDGLEILNEPDPDE